MYNTVNGMGVHHPCAHAGRSCGLYTRRWHTCFSAWHAPAPAPHKERQTHTEREREEGGGDASTMVCT
jgi:hypothetical protein